MTAPWWIGLDAAWFGVLIFSVPQAATRIAAALSAAQARAILTSRRIGRGLYERYDHGVSTKLRRALVAPAMMGCLMLVGCGHSVSAGTGGTVQVALGEYRLTPSSIRAHAGPLTIVATNVGRLTHN